MTHTLPHRLEQPDVRLYADLVYKNAPDWAGRPAHPLKYYVLLPEEKSERPLPVYLWIGGGAWMISTPERRLPSLCAFAYQGFAAISVDYRVSSQGCWPAPYEDVVDAILYLKAHSKEYNLDMHNVVISGCSAGAHLAAHVALRLAAEDICIRAAICQCGVYDFLQPTNESDKNFYPAESGPDVVESEEDPVALLLGGKPQNCRAVAEQASPVNYVTPQAPPFLLFHGTGDPVISQTQSKLLYQRLLAAGVEAELYYLEGAGHATAEFGQPVIEQISLAFAQKFI